MKPRPLAVPLALLLVLTCGALAFFIYYGPSLPPVVATHFSADGRPDGWMDRVKFIVVMSAISFMVPPFVAVALGVMPRILPVSMVNLPNREYWLAPERREQTLSVLMYYGLWLGCIVQGFLVAIAISVARANASDAVVLRPWLPVACLMACLAAFLVAFTREFTVRS